MSDEVQTLGSTPPPEKKPEVLDKSQYESIKAEAESATDDALRSFDVRDQKFQIREQVSAAVLLDLACVGDKNTPQVDQLRAMRIFLDAALEPDHQAEFGQLLRRAEPPIEFEELGKIVESMVQKVAQRPTEQP